MSYFFSVDIKTCTAEIENIYSQSEHNLFLYVFVYIFLLFTNIYCDFLGYNGVIKGTVTFREKLPVEQFIETVLVKMTRDISIEYASQQRVIAETPTITIKAWREAALWLKKARYVRMEDSAGFSVYYVASSQLDSEVDFTNEYIQALKKIDEFKSLGEYRENRFGKFWTVNLDKTINWKTVSSCDCPSFLKNYHCKHVIGLSLGNGICKLPKKALTTEIKKAVAKKGRCAKATPALQK